MNTVLYWFVLGAAAEDSYGDGPEGLQRNSGRTFFFDLEKSRIEGYLTTSQ